jgi:hypothetical protein
VTTNLPRWPARGKADNLAMLNWLNEKLAVIGEAAIDDEIRKWNSKTKILDFALDFAEHGRVDLLRHVLVELTKDARVAKFINLPKQRKGVRWRTHPLDAMFNSTLAWAADDTGRIRALWREHFGKKRRRASDGWSAEQFAAKRWNVDVRQIISRAKKPKRRFA